MGKRGPAKTPTPILKLHGSRRANTRESTEPAFETGSGKYPHWLNTDGRKEWTRLVEILDRAGVLTEADRNALARYCKLWMEWRKCQQFIDRNGTTYMPKDDCGKPKGKLMKFPQVDYSLKLSTQLLRLEQEFGLTPAARSNVRVENMANEGCVNPKLRFFNGGA